MGRIPASQPLGPEELPSFHLTARGTRARPAEVKWLGMWDHKWPLANLTLEAKPPCPAVPGLPHHEVRVQAVKARDSGTTQSPGNASLTRTSP